MNLHYQIMNIPTNPEVETWDVTSRRLYKTGHRDARHAVALLALEADRYIAELERQLQVAKTGEGCPHGCVRPSQCVDCIKERA